MTDGRATFDVDTDDLDAMMRFLSTRGIRSITSQPPTLEELFLRHCAGKPEDGQAAAAGGA